MFEDEDGYFGAFHVPSGMKRLANRVHTAIHVAVPHSAIMDKINKKKRDAAGKLGVQPGSRWSFLSRR